MKELQIIIRESARLKAENIRAVLATVIDVKGSSYRLPGAKMLMEPVLFFLLLPFMFSLFTLRRLMVRFPRRAV